MNFNMNRIYGLNMEKIFITIYFISIILFFVRLPFDNRVFGEIFQHSDYLDTGMDFFNSILCTQYGEPYERFKTLYPPLANIFYYYLYSCIPIDVSSAWSINHNNFWTLRSFKADLRIWQWSLLPFIIYIQVQTTLGYIMIRQYLKDNSKLLALCILFSVGMLFATERGNIITFTMFLVLFFCFNYDSNNSTLRKTAIIALIFAVGLKIYPIVFSVILIKKRMYKDFFTILLLSIAVIILPFLCFGGYESLKIWIDVITGFGTGAKLPTGTQFIGFVQFFYTFLHSNYFPKELSTQIPLIITLINITNIILIIVIIIYIFWENCKWKMLLAIGLLLVFGQKSSPIYNTVFLIPSLIMFFGENKKINNENIVYFLFWILIMIPLPFFSHLGTAWVIRCLTIYSMVILIICRLIKYMKGCIE